MVHRCKCQGDASRDASLVAAMQAMALNTLHQPLEREDNMDSLTCSNPCVTPVEGSVQSNDAVEGGHD